MELRSLSMYPDDEYYVHKVQGKELANGMSDSMLAKLTKATGMGAGKLPDKEDRKWKNNLDVGAPTTVAQPPLVSTQKRPSDASPQYPATSPTTSEPGRPSRRGTKRRYNDESFEGYGEGFADDTHDTRSLDNDDVDASLAGKRKRRRVGVISSCQSTPEVELPSNSPDASYAPRKAAAKKPTQRKRTAQKGKKRN